MIRPRWGIECDNKPFSVKNLNLNLCLKISTKLNFENTLRTKIALPNKAGILWAG